MRSLFLSPFRAVMSRRLRHATSVVLVAILAVSSAASCTALPEDRPEIAAWWANRVVALAGGRPEPPFGLYLSSWSLGNYSLYWYPGPAFVPEPPADRWELRIDRGPWIPHDVWRSDISNPPSMFMLIRTPPPEDGTVLSVRGVSTAGPGPAAIITVDLPSRLGPLDLDPSSDSARSRRSVEDPPGR